MEGCKCLVFGLSNFAPICSGPVIIMGNFEILLFLRMRQYYICETAKVKSAYVEGEKRPIHIMWLKISCFPPYLPIPLFCGRSAIIAQAHVEVPHYVVSARNPCRKIGPIRSYASPISCAIQESHEEKHLCLS
jgi:hypothetical protein